MLVSRKDIIRHGGIGMKIYLFSTETGIYQGEDFADTPPMVAGRGTLPTGATTIAPPPFENGSVPVFLAAENRWELRPAAHRGKREG